jgi:solute carrier family 24 (sodium/potassium/calcium exchanger), member 6
VADVTVAKMGYPMMAMSACFGGPMLSISRNFLSNLDILLGVGVSGLFMNLTSMPGYQVTISPTLLVSTASLFITLTSMLIVVPLNKWRMTRRFGICLVIFFTLSTIASVLVEILI